MKNNTKDSTGSVATPILQDVTDRQKTDAKLRNPSLSETPAKPADLYQDAGGGYNTNFTFPQE